MNNTSKTMPSTRLRLPSNNKIVKSAVKPMQIGKSRLKMTSSAVKTFIAAQTPTTTNRLKRFEPITLLSAMSLLPARPAVMLTAASGALVPAATIVRPMTTDGILKSLATSLLPSTKKSAPLMSKIKPTIKSKYSTNYLSFAKGVILQKKMTPIAPMQ